MVEDGRRVLSSVVASQIETHQRYGGVVPELASREHMRAITPVVAEALTRAGCGWADLSGVACTYGPGLLGSLLVGVTYAKAISLAHGMPLIAVNHLEGHIHAVVLEHPGTELPALALIVSGGPLMIPILICSVISLALIIEKTFFFLSIRADISSIKQCFLF